MNWHNQKVLVTGAGGFIGSRLVERLVELDCDVRALIRYNSSDSWGWLDKSDVKNQIEVVLGDLRDKDSLMAALKDINIVFHLGALVGIPYSYNAPQSYYQTNVIGSLNLFQCALDIGTGLIINTSTSEVYGTAQYVPMDENHPLQSQSPYAASKTATDKLAESFFHSYGLPITTVRPFNTYGPRQSARAIIPTIVLQGLIGGEINLGNLHPPRDFNYVDDTGEGFVCAARHGAGFGTVFNLGSGKDVSIGDLSEIILNLMDVKGNIFQDYQRIRPEASEVELLCADSTRARQILGWEPKFDLEAGLLVTIDWIRRNIDWYRPNTYTI